MSRYFNRLAGRSGLKMAKKSNGATDGLVDRRVVASQISDNNQRGNQSAGTDIEVHQEFEVAVRPQIPAPVIAPTQQFAQTAVPLYSPTREVDARDVDSVSDHNSLPLNDQSGVTETNAMESTQQQKDKGQPGERLGGQDIAMASQDVLEKNQPEIRIQDLEKPFVTKAFEPEQALEQPGTMTKVGLIEVPGTVPEVQKPADNIKGPQSEIPIHEIKETDIEHNSIEVTVVNSTHNQQTKFKQSVAPDLKVTQGTNQKASINPQVHEKNNVEIRIGKIDLEVHQALPPSPAAKTNFKQSDAKAQGNSLSRYYLKGL